MKNKNLNYWVITVALAGFLFGFDTIVISGADLPIQKLWGSDYPCVGFLNFIIPFADNCGDAFHGFFIMSMALWGTVFGALLGGIPCDKFGRKKTLRSKTKEINTQVIDNQFVSLPTCFSNRKF